MSDSVLVARNSNNVQLKKSHPDAVIPVYQTAGSAGADLVSVEDVDIAPGKVVMVDVGFSIAIPEGFQIEVRPRSGLAVKHAVTVLNSPGTIDSDYRGPVKVLLINHGTEAYMVNKGDRIAQMVIAPVCRPSDGIIEEVKNLDATARGEGGFGSTGRN